MAASLRRTAHPVTTHSVTTRRVPSGPRVGENPRPPRYRLLAAAAALPRRQPERPSESFERDCPGCGQTITFTQLVGPAGVEYAIEDHDCGGSTPA